MKSICVEAFGEPGVLKLAEVEDLQPEPGQVVVRIQAAGVNPVDTYIRAGTYARKPSLPYCPGSDAAGLVARIGSDVKNISVGDRVYLTGSLTGTYAEETLCAPSQVHPLPDEVSFEQGAALGIPYLTAHFALFGRARAKAGETVLIHGATGGVGLAAIQWARRAGIKTIGTGGSEAGRALLVREQVDVVLDHLRASYLDHIMEATSGTGVDVILEMLANVNLGKDLGLLAQGGRVAVIGNRGSVEINPRDVMARNAEILGVMLFGAPADTIAAIHQELQAGLKDGSLRPVVGRVLPLADAAEAHAAVLRPGALGKIVLKP